MTQPNADGTQSDTADLGAHDRPTEHAKLLFTVDGDHSETLLGVVCDLITDGHQELAIGVPKVVPSQTPLDSEQAHSEAGEEAAKYALKAKQSCEAVHDAQQLVMVGHSRERILQKLVREHGISTLVTEGRPASSIQKILGMKQFDDAEFSLDCDTIIASNIARLSSIESILVAVARGPHSGMAVDVGAALARQHQASLELLHVEDPAGDEEITGEQLLQTASERVGTYEAVSQTHLREEDVARRIIDHAGSFDITVFGAPREGVLRQFLFGTIPDEARSETAGPVLVTHRGGVETSWLERWV